MITGIDNGVMTTDLDANHLRILNIFKLVPTPNGIIDTHDPRLDDPRVPIEGSVTNVSIAASASISQSKLDFDGNIPAFWLGFDNIHAAPGGQTEYLSNKNIPGGYAGLDGTGKVAPAQLPDDVGTGTVTSVDLTMPPEFNVAGSPVTTAGSIDVTWANIADGSWFGNSSGVSAAPTFNTTPILVSMVPQLPASKITSGVLDPARLPVAVGIGISSSKGAVPDPGAVGNPTDYLGRDMLYHPKPSIGPAYQPTVPNPVVFSTGSAPNQFAITDSLSGAIIFYKITGMTDYIEKVTPTVEVLPGKTIDMYAAKAGYNNSDIVSLTN